MTRSSAQYSLNKTDQHDLGGVSPRVSFDPMAVNRRRRAPVAAEPPPPWGYRLTCFCGETITLEPTEGNTEECPEKCGGRASFLDGMTTLEKADD